MRIKHWLPAAITLLLSSCSGSDLGFYSWDDNSNNYHQAGNSSYLPDDAHTKYGYSATSDDTGPYVDPPPSHKFVPPPPSYHFATSESPPKQGALDSDFIQRQDQRAYTIQLPDDSDPARVAETLQEVPKTGRTTQYRYQKDGETRYGGTLGSYPSREAAEAAMHELPANVRDSAHVTQWDEIKSKVGQSSPSPIVSPKTESDRPKME